MIRKKSITVTILFGTILLLSLASLAFTAVASSSLQFGKLQDKPSWAGRSGGPNGGDGDSDTTIIYELSIEIDYMKGHEPSPEVLEYIETYYNARGIKVTFFVDDVYGYSDTVDDPTPTTGITDADFWAIEATYNDNDNGYFDHWKWVLFGTTVAGESSVVGYCWVAINKNDILAGNYIFIADQKADAWALDNKIVTTGAEAAVLMHELGHSLGVGKWHRLFGELYDPDPGSVMSYLSTDNAECYGAWYYSDEYWVTRNLGYYEEIVT